MILFTVSLYSHDPNRMPRFHYEDVLVIPITEEQEGQLPPSGPRQIEYIISMVKSIFGEAWYEKNKNLIQITRYFSGGIK